MVGGGFVTFKEGDTSRTLGKHRRPNDAYWPDAKPTMHIGLTANTYTHLAMAKSWAPFSIFSHVVCSWLAVCVIKVVMSLSTFAVDQLHSPNLILR